jgi:uncharacterized membrane protein|tara:strand:+ start:1322 stop:1699 length:378 start_codon:yes stop_codon:yes gene_type:complete
MKLIKEYLLFSLIFTLIDAVYLYSASNHFNKQLKKIQSSPLSLKPFSTLLCYIALTTGIFYFGIMKNLTVKEMFFLGIFVYGVYETTNHAIFKKWQWNTVLMDTLWGGILFSLSVFVFKKVNKLV